MIALLAALIALTGATVWTGSGPPLENATILIRGDRIRAIGPNVKIPEGATVISLEGRIVTPGLIDANTRLGLAELVPREPGAIDGRRDAPDERNRAALRVADTWNPYSATIEIARREGITQALVVPAGGVLSGQSAWVELGAVPSVRRESAALHVSLQGRHPAHGARAEAFLALRTALDDAHLYAAPGNRGAYIRRNLRKLDAGPEALDTLGRALDNNLKVVIEVDRASDIRTALSIIREHELDAVLSGVAEGWMVAPAIARAGIPVLVDPLENLPPDLDRLHGQTRNAQLLLEAGVEVAFITRGPVTQVGRLRLAAGNAVAEGFPRRAALAAITRVPAEIFDMGQRGALKPGARADLVVWNGDPFEPLSWATEMWIAGDRVDLTSREDLLTDRYRELPNEAVDAASPPPDSDAQATSP